MALYKNNMMEIDLNKSKTIQQFAKIEIGEGDNESDQFGVRVFRDGNPVDLPGITCVGYFIRADGITLVISGTVSGNEAFIKLPEAAYAVEGYFSLTIKLSGIGFVNTVRIIEGSVINTTTGTVYDPASIVPSLADLEEIIDEAEAAAADINKWTIGATQITGTRYKIVATKAT